MNKTRIHAQGLNYLCVYDGCGLLLLQGEDPPQKFFVIIKIRSLYSTLGKCHRHSIYVHTAGMHVLWVDCCNDIHEVIVQTINHNFLICYLSPMLYQESITVMDSWLYIHVWIVEQRNGLEMQWASGVPSILCPVNNNSCSTIHD